MLRRARNYQLDALRVSDTLRHFGYFVDMRMGKCLLAIRRAQRWKVTGPKLIVSPYSAFDGWQDELCLEEQPQANELIGTRKQRLKILDSIHDSESDWYIINKEGYISLPEIANTDWGMVIADESRFMANPRTAQSKFYVKSFNSIPHKIILTGTPDYHHKLDYFQQIAFLDKTILPYKNYWDFRNKAFHQFYYDFIMKKTHAEIFDQALSKHCYFLRRKDVNIGRKKVYIKRVLPLARKFIAPYKTLEDEYVMEYKGVTSKSIYAPRTFTWMMRLCGGFVETKLEWLGKINEILYLLKNDLRGEQVVIGCRFKCEINSLTEYINKDTDLKRIGVTAIKIHGDISKKKIRENKVLFKTGKIKILIAQHSIIAHGVDLKNATTIIHYSQPTAPEIRDQFDDRIITCSDELTVLIIDILIKDTIDYDARITHIEGTGQREVYEKTIKRRQCA